MYVHVDMSKSVLSEYFQKQERSGSRKNVLKVKNKKGQVVEKMYWRLTSHFDFFKNVGQIKFLDNLVQEFPAGYIFFFWNNVYNSN